VDERKKSLLIPLAVGAIGLVMAHHKMVLSGLAFTQSDPGDTRLVHLLMEHAWRWLLGQPAHADLWSPPFFFPITGHLAWSENMLGAAPLYFPFRLLGFEPFTAFQLWGLAVGALNFTSAYFLLKRCFDFSRWGSAVGAALFAYSAIRINQTMHWQLFPHFYTVWAAHAAYRLANASSLSPRDTVRFIVLLAASAVGQMWASIYLGWFMAFVFAVGLGLGLAWEKPRRELVGLVKRYWLALGLAAVGAAMALYPMAWRYLAIEKQFGGRPYQEVLTMLPMARVWLHLGSGSWFWAWLGKLDWFQGIPMEHEQRCGFGLIATAVSVVTFVRLRAQQRVLFVGTLLSVLVLTTTLYAADGTSPWRYVYDYFPAAHAIRAVARGAIVYMLGVSVGVAAALTALASHPRLKWVVVPLGMLLVAEQGYSTPAFEKAKNNEDIAEIVRNLEPGCEAFVMSPAQGYGPYWKYQLDAMWAGIEAKVPTINGYSGQSPANWALGDTNLRSAFDDNRVAQAAQLWVNSQPSLRGKKLCWARVGFNEGQYASRFVGQKVPAALTAGERSEVEVTFKNLGPKPWPAGVGVRLGAQSPIDSTRWGPNRVELPHEVPAGGAVTFQFAITAPPQPGRYGFQWRLVHDGVQWIGPMSKFVVIDVAAAPPPPPAPLSSQPP
jgi:Ig-like domain from next to BRCA1 gene